MSRERNRSHPPNSHESDRQKEHCRVAAVSPFFCWRSFWSSARQLGTSFSTTTIPRTCPRIPWSRTASRGKASPGASPRSRRLIGTRSLGSRTCSIANCSACGPGWHHGMNVAFHAVNSILLYLLLLRMTGAFWPSAVVAAAFRPASSPRRIGCLDGRTQGRAEHDVRSAGSPWRTSATCGGRPPSATCSSCCSSSWG